LGATTSYAYDSLDNLIETVTPVGEYTSYIRDGQGHLLSVTDPMGGSTAYTYGGAPGDVTAVTDPDGRVTQFGYDAYGDTVSHTTSPTTGSADTDTTVFDAAGQPVCGATATATAKGVHCPAAGAARVAGTTTTVYDAAGRTTSVTDPAGHTTSYGYDADGNRTSVTDPAGRTTTTVYDAIGRSTSTTTGAGSTSGKTYDLAPGSGPCATAVGAVAYCTGSTDPGGAVTVDFFDARDQLIAETTPGNRTTANGYDIAGHLTSVTDPAGRTTSYTYDLAGRRQSVAYSDPGTPGATFGYDLDGHRMNVQDGTGTTTYLYDQNGRLADTVDGSGAEVTYGRDGAGNVSTLTYPGGHQVARTYDGAGRLSSVTDWLGHTTTFGYDADGRPTHTGYPGGDNLSNTYDTAGSLTATQVTGVGGTTLAALAYTRAADGRTTAEAASGALSGSPAYGYDAGSRLTSAGGATYGYDAAGHATSFGATVLAYNSAGELTTATTGAATTTFAYDAAGQRTGSASSAGGLAYSYDQAGNLTGVAGSEVAPVVTSVSPATGPAGGGTAVTITGTGLTAATAVHFGAAKAAFTVKSDTAITATAPAGTGTQGVTVTTPGGTSPVTATTRFNYVTAPAVTRIAPPAGVLAGGGKVTITGTGLSGATGVHFGSKAASFTAGTSTSLTAKAPSGTGTVDITVTTAGGTSAKTTADHYLYTNAPVITGVSPTAGPLGGGTQVTVSGVNLGGPTAVHFGTKTARFTAVSGTSLRATAPAGVRTVDVTVSTRLGTSAKVTADHFAYWPRPTVTKVAPASGSTKGGTGVTITGTWVAGASAVHFGSKAAKITKVTSTVVTATAPAGSGTVDITVTAPGGTSAHTTHDRFTYKTTAAAARTAAATPRPLGAYTYNADGLRVSRSVGGTVSHLAWDGSGNVPLLLDDGGSAYVYGPGGLPVEQVSAAGTATYFVHDAIGSTRVLLAADGTVAATFGYDAYGALTKSTGGATTPLLYAAGYRDAETGLYYLINRVYDPSTGQFLTRDPAVAVTGTPYAYAGDDPVNAVDPLGLTWWKPSTWDKSTWESAASNAKLVALGAGVVMGLAALCVVTACVGDAVALGAAGLAYTAGDFVATVATGTAIGSEINGGCLYGEGAAECAKAVGNAAIDLTLARYGDSAIERLGFRPKTIADKFISDQAQDYAGNALKWGYDSLLPSQERSKPC
jgi:RHS repeat-associated protein